MRAQAIGFMIRGHPAYVDLYNRCRHAIQTSGA